MSNEGVCMIGLFMLISADERTKLEQIYYKYRNDMFKLAYSIVKDPDDAQDIVQSCIVKLSEHLEKIDVGNEKSCKAYVLAVVRSRSINHFNLQRKVVHLPFEEVTDDEVISREDVEEYILNAEKSKELSSILKSINQEYANLIILKYYHDLTNQEIADLTGNTLNNIGVQLYRARQSLKRAL